MNPFLHLDLRLSITSQEELINAIQLMFCHCRQVPQPYSPVVSPTSFALPPAKYKSQGKVPIIWETHQRNVFLNSIWALSSPHLELLWGIGKIIDLWNCKCGLPCDWAKDGRRGGVGAVCQMSSLASHVMRSCPSAPQPSHRSMCLAPSA